MFFFLQISTQVDIIVLQTYAQASERDDASLMNINVYSEYLMSYDESEGAM